MNDSKLNTVEKQQKPVANKIDKIILSLALIIPIAFVAYRYFTAPPAGFCMAENRYIPAEEFIKKVVKNNRYLQNSELEANNHSLINCCNVFRVEGGFWSKILRGDEGVRVRFEYKKAASSITKDRPEKYSYAVASFYSCGDVLKWPDTVGLIFFDFNSLNDEQHSWLRVVKDANFIKWSSDNNQITESLNTNQKINGVSLD